VQSLHVGDDANAEYLPAEHGVHVASPDDE
jgi:hypothetical protein